MRSSGSIHRVPAARPRGLITYDGLPVSAGGGHRLRGKDRIAAWRSVAAFLDSFTTTTTPHEVRLHLVEGPRVDGRFSKDALRLISSTFGPPGEQMPMPSARGEVEHRWGIDPTDVEAALATLRALEPFPDHWLGAPLVLAVRSTFALRDPRTGEPFAHQDPALYGGQEAAWRLALGSSRLYLRLSARSTCMLVLSLPFPEVDDRVRAYASAVDESLPFRLSRKHWSRWQLNARGTRYYSRRVSVLDG